MVRYAQLTLVLLIVLPVLATIDSRELNEKLSIISVEPFIQINSEHLFNLTFCYNQECNSRENLKTIVIPEEEFANREGIYFLEIYLGNETYEYPFEYNVKTPLIVSEEPKLIDSKTFSITDKNTREVYFDGVTLFFEGLSELDYDYKETSVDFSISAEKTELEVRNPNFKYLCEMRTIPKCILVNQLPFKSELSNQSYKLAKDTLEENFKEYLVDDSFFYKIIDDGTDIQDFLVSTPNSENYNESPAQVSLYLNLSKDNVTEEELGEFTKGLIEEEKKMLSLLKSEETELALIEFEDTQDIEGDFYNLGLSEILPKDAKNIKIYSEYGSINSFSNSQSLTILDQIQKKATIGAPVVWTILTEKGTVEYQTSAPKKTEIQTPSGKKIVIYSDSIDHYEEVFSFTDLPELDYKPKLFHIVDGSRVDVTDNPDYEVTYVDTNSNSLYDKIEWITPHLSEEIFEIDLTILNIQSYPTVGGNWTVMFETSGVANLKIKVVNGTTWSNVNETEDLKFLEIKCGDSLLDYSWINNSVFIENYTCNYTGYETSKVISYGAHTLEFNYGDIVKLASNEATYNVTACGTLSELGATYLLQNDVSANTHCFTIGNHNITLDCQGHAINYSRTQAGYAINDMSEYDYLTVKNCRIYQTSSLKTNAYAILLDNSLGSKIVNNTINTIAAQGLGIYLVNSSYTQVFNNTVITTGTDSYGLSMYDSAVSNEIINNTITTTNQYSYGILLNLNVNLNTIENNNISTSNYKAYGIWVYSTSNSNTIIQNVISNSGQEGHGLRVYDSINSNISDNNVSVSGASAHGLQFYNNADSNTIYNNNLESTKSYGICLNYSTTAPEGNLIYNNWISGESVPVMFPATILSNNWNTTNQSGTRIYGTGNYIGGNYYTNSTGNGFSDTCPDINEDGFCDEDYNVTTNSVCSGVTCGDNVDYLALSDKYNSTYPLYCKNLDTENKTYYLANNVSSTDTCFTIGANNITLDCQGYTINYSQSSVGYGISNAGQYDSITIRNCVIVQGSESEDSHGILFWGSTGGLIENNTITTQGNSSYAIELYSSANQNTIEKNNVTVYGSSSVALTIYSSCDLNIVKNNTVNVLGYAASGIGLLLYSDSNTVEENTIITDELYAYGIWLYASVDSTIRNNVVSTSNDYSHGIYLLVDSNNNRVANETYNTLGNYSFGVLIVDSSYNNFTNISIATLGEEANGFRIYNNSHVNQLIDSSVQSFQSLAVYLWSDGNKIPENNTLYNNLLNGSIQPVGFSSFKAPNYWNTTNQSGTRIYGTGNYIGGNYYTNSTGNGFSDTCDDDNGDGFCDDYYNLSSDLACNETTCGVNIDYLPLAEMEIIDYNITYSKFNGSTTEFDEHPTPDSIENAILEITSFGKVMWQGIINATNQNFDLYVNITQNEISVGAVNLHSSLNSSANLSLYGLSFVYPIILKNGQLCADCYVLSYSEGTLLFNVSSFSSYSVGEGTNLSIWDDTDESAKGTGELITFFANYTNITSGNPINGTGVYCEFIENSSGTWSTPANMSFNQSTKIYWINKSFGSEGTYYFNVSCFNDLGYANLSALDDFNIGSPDFSINEITFSEMSPIENQNITVYINVTELNGVNETEIKLQLNTSIWNGTEWIFEQSQNKTINITGDTSQLEEFNWTVEPGLHNFFAFIDADDSKEESNEDNNQLSENFSMTVWTYYYGTTNNTLVLGDNTSYQLSSWMPSIQSGNVIFLDYDSEVMFFNLKPLDASDSDFEEADLALNIFGYPDSIEELYDSDHNDLADSVRNFTVMGVLIENVPVIQSTDNNNFLTGIFWDPDDGGASYNGTQDIVFITEINSNSTGKYGDYDYEIKIPSKLKLLKGTTDLANIYIDVN